MNNLFSKQNEPDRIKLIAAWRQVYSQGKKLNGYVFFGTLTAAIIIPTLGAIVPQYATEIGLTGGVLSILLTIFVKDLPKKKAETGAKIQEQFDTELYNLPWEKVVAKEKESPVTIAEAYLKKEKYWGSYDEVVKGERIANWYADYSKLDTSHAILHCQQENFNWDSKQRKNYVNFLTFVVVTLLVAGFAMGHFYLKLDFPNILLKVIFPLSSLLLYLYQTLKNNKEASQTLEEKSKQALSISEKYKKSATPIPMEELRELQNALYESRKNGDLVPDWYYAKIKPWFDKIFKATAEQANR